MDSIEARMPTLVILASVDQVVANMYLECAAKISIFQLFL